MSDSEAMIEYQLGKEYEFTVISIPSKKQKRLARQAKRSYIALVKDADNCVFQVSFKEGLKEGQLVKCLVSGFHNDTNKPLLALSLSEQPENNRPRPTETTRSVKVIYTPMGNKR